MYRNRKDLIWKNATDTSKNIFKHDSLKETCVFITKKLHVQCLLDEDNDQFILKTDMLLSEDDVLKVLLD